MTPDIRVASSARMPPSIRRVLEASTVDGMATRAWLDSAATTPGRKACLLNILAALSVTAAPGCQPLIGRLCEVFTVKVDRVGGIFDPSIRPALDALVVTTAFYADIGRPLPIHREMVQALPARLQDPTLATVPLRSYRGEGKPSVQIVLAEGPPHYTVADVDLDECNVDQDVVGAIGHGLEILRGRHDGPTDHLRLRARLAAGPAAPFLCYTLTDGAA